MCFEVFFFSYEHQDDSANTVENDEQQQLRASIANSAGTCDFLPNSWTWKTKKEKKNRGEEVHWQIHSDAMQTAELFCILFFFLDLVNLRNIN